MNRENTIGSYGTNERCPVVTHRQWQSLLHGVLQTDKKPNDTIVTLEKVVKFNCLIAL